MGPEAAASPRKQQQQPAATRRAWPSWRGMALAAVAVVMVVSQLVSYKPHFDAHLAKHRILRNLQAQPALRLSFELKRKSMYVHGASAFDVVAVPAPKEESDGNSLVYNGVASFEEGSLTHEYSLVDRTAYYTSRPTGGDVADSSKTGCLPAGMVPAIETVLGAIDTATTATHLVDAEKAQSACPGGSLMAFDFEGEHFLLCSRNSAFSPMSNDGFKILGTDLNIDVTYESSAPTISVPDLPAGVADICGRVPANQAIAPSGVSLLTRSFSEWGHRALRAEATESWITSLIETVTGISESSGNSCSSTQRTCVFVAGYGSSTDYGLTSNDPRSYFGDEIADYAPCCSSIQYITLDTKGYAWNDQTLQQRLVDLLVQVSGTSDSSSGTVSDTIIVAHSMGNLMLAGAIANSLLSLDSSTTWVGNSGPMKGSMGSNYLQEACDGSLTSVVEDILDLLGKCEAPVGAVAMAYQGSEYSTTALDEDYAAAQTAYAANVDAVLCSSSRSGLSSIVEAVYILAGKTIPHESDENDGLVEYDSCAVGLDTSTFDNTYTSTNYLTKLNHADAAFRYGDSLFSDKKKPMKWFENLL